MTTNIFFPYFYLSNDILLRHQYIYAKSLARVLPSDRPPRDSKPIKRCISELNQLDFFQHIIPPERIDWISRRFLTVIEYWYDRQLPDYLRLIGKYEKERTSAKTFHFCRVGVWPELVQRLLDLEIATVDHYNEWCFSTRKMVMIFNICIALYYQHRDRSYRCTDDIEQEQLATLIECLPSGSSDDTDTLRAVLEFSYPIPQHILSFQTERLQTLRDNIEPLAGRLAETILDTVSRINHQPTLADIPAVLKQQADAIESVTQSLQVKFQSHNESCRRFYAQYHWYLDQPEWKAEQKPQDPISSNQCSFAIRLLPVAPSEKERIFKYPGCYLWAQESSHWIKKQGFLQSLILKLWKSA